jgi:DNA-binding NarL/FixJ family response regulator
MRPIAAGQLSRRQQQVLTLAAQGFDGVEIGKQLGLSSSTVRQHLCKIHERLQARNTTHAVVIALQHQLICLEDLHADST